MKLNRKQTIQLLSEQILKEVLFQIRFLIREEFEIERKRTLKQVRQLLSEYSSTEAIQQTTSNKKLQETILPPSNGEKKKKTSITTGHPVVDSILEEIEVPSTEVIDENVLLNEYANIPNNNSDNRTVDQILQINNSFKFDPKTMDPSLMDWNSIVDKVDNAAKKTL